MNIFASYNICTSCISFYVHIWSVFTPKIIPPPAIKNSFITKIKKKNMHLSAVSHNIVSDKSFGKISISPSSFYQCLEINTTTNKKNYLFTLNLKAIKINKFIKKNCHFFIFFCFIANQNILTEMIGFTFCNWHF